MYPIPFDRPKKTDRKTSQDVQKLRESHMNAMSGNPEGSEEPPKRRNSLPEAIQEFNMMKEREESFYEYIRRSD